MMKSLMIHILLCLSFTQPLTLDTHYHLSPVPLPPAATAPSYDAFSSSLGLKNTVVTQPAKTMSDHSYMLEHLSATRRGVALLTPPLPPDAPSFTARPHPTAVTDAQSYSALSQSNPYLSGARFNPSLWPSSGVPSELLRLYAHLGSPPDGFDPSRSERFGSSSQSRNGVASLLLMSGGWAAHEDLALRLVSLSPTTPVVVDHMGFCPLGREGDVAYGRLLDLVKDAENVYVRCSAPFRTGEGYGEVGRERVEGLVRAKGERALWGTDWPFEGRAEEWMRVCEGLGVEDGPGEKLYGFDES